MAKKAALGKGLAALFDQNPLPVEEKISAEEVNLLPLEKIVPNPDQPRRNFNEEKLAELAESLRQYGMVQPLVVVEAKDGKYMIVAGERRFRAANLAGLKEIPCVVKDLSPAEIIEIALIENIQRENLNVIEEAETYRRLMDEYKYTQAALAKKLGKSRPHIANTLRLLTLMPELKQFLAEGLLSAGHARAVLMASQPKDQLVLAKSIVEDGLSVRKAEDLARAMNEIAEKKTEEKPAPKKAEVSLNAPLLQDMEARLRSRLATKVEIKESGRGGRITIEYYSDDDLNRLIEALFPNEEF